MKTVIGIDEAGVGPILGPLIVSGVKVFMQHVQDLEDLGVMDSKKYGSNSESRKKREKIFFLSKGYIIDSCVQEITPKMLDTNNMYELEFKAWLRILDGLDWQNTDIIYLAQLGQTKLDTVIEFFCKNQKDFQKDLFLKKVIYEKNADEKYIPVSLASILAKNTRDFKIQEICNNLGCEYISGYPNKNTAKFLNNYFLQHSKLPAHIRKNRNWLPLQDLIQKELVNNSV